jgi:hypothetical protein
LKSEPWLPTLETVAIAIYPQPGPARNRDKWDVVGAVVLIVLLAIVVGVAVWAIATGRTFSGL